MASYSRRAFGKLVVAGAVVAAAATTVAGAANTRFGATTYSYRDLFRVPGEGNLDDVLRAVKRSGVTFLELAAMNVEPAGPNTGPAAPIPPAAYPRQVVVLSPEQVAAAKIRVRNALRDWRLATPAADFELVRSEFYREAGVTIHSYAVEFEPSFTDAEIDAVFTQAKALGVVALTSPLTMEMATRLVPFMAKHNLPIGIHNQVDGNSAGFVSTANLEAALALSPSYGVKLDIGHITASNRDAVAEFRKYEARVLHVNVQDRLRNNGLSQRLGEGDTPIAAVLAAVKASARDIPAILEHSHVGIGTSAEEVAVSLAYLKAQAR